MSSNLYADIILPISVDNLFTYHISGRLSGKILPGLAVMVPVGRQKRYTGIIHNTHNRKPGFSQIKDIIEIIDDDPVVSEAQLQFWDWMADYYHCTSGDIMSAALPSAILSGIKHGEELLKTVSYIEFSKEYTDRELNIILDDLKKAPARQRLIIEFLEMTSYTDNPQSAKVLRKALLKQAGTSSTVLSKLIEEGIFRQIENKVSRLDENIKGNRQLKVLSSSQNSALRKISSEFENKTTVLLHGVTSSGKTEIYIHLIEQYLRKGKKTLYLLPEIALTTQIINRLRSHFGNLVGVYHSGLNEKERAEVYNRMQGESSLDEYMILLGVRSSLFLPFENTGLIIVDEEHDTSYKQFDPAPRYNARDSAIMMATMTGAKVLLGSATPSVESRYNAEKGKYGYAYIGDRFGEINMPEILLSDSNEAYRKKAMISHFTPALINSIDEALENKEQVVLFRNRRGFAHYLICSDCGWTPVCPNCSVNFTYHKNPNRLYCHYCGSSDSLPSRCGSCNSTNVKLRGFGTEKVEDEISILFPDARIARMDYDSTRRKGSMEKIIKDLEKGKTDILIGTQMISKGLDIENLTVVGILNIDAMLFYPDFRAHERCYQLAAQVSGRAGRRTTRGKVIIQTADPAHPVMKQIVENNYDGMYRGQLTERKEFNYPPFSRLVRIYLKHKERNTVEGASELLAVSLRKELGNRVLGPEYPPHARIQNIYAKSILLKVSKDTSYRYVNELIKRYSSYVKKRKEYSALRIYSDIDPQ